VKSHIFIYLFILAGLGAFLRDPLICGSLKGFCVWVGFKSTYEGGSYLKRTGRTPLALSDRFDGCADNEIVVVINDHRTSLPRSHTIPLHHLTPASPMKKGDHVVILSGDYKGHVGKVVQCQKKERKVKILMDGWPLTYDFAVVCRLTQEQ
jgi:KOW motif